MAQAAQHEVNEKASRGAPLFLASAASFMGTACACFSAAQRASQAARVKAEGKAKKSSDKRAEIEARLPNIIDAHIVNAGYKSSDQIAGELRRSGLIALDRKELRKMVAAVKRSRASRPPAN